MGSPEIMLSTMYQRNRRISWVFTQEAHLPSLGPQGMTSPAAARDVPVHTGNTDAFSATMHRVHEAYHRVTHARWPTWAACLLGLTTLLCVGISWGSCSDQDKVSHGRRLGEGETMCIACKNNFKTISNRKWKKCEFAWRLRMMPTLVTAAPADPRSGGKTSGEAPVAVTNRTVEDQTPALPPAAEKNVRDSLMMHPMTASYPGVCKKCWASSTNDAQRAFIFNVAIYVASQKRKHVEDDGMFLSEYPRKNGRTHLDSEGYFEDEITAQLFNFMISKDQYKMSLKLRTDARFKFRCD